MKHYTWLDDKPKFKDECIVIAATDFGGQWEYKSYMIEWIASPDGMYLAWCDMDGEEFGDLNDFKADKYMTIPIL